MAHPEGQRPIPQKLLPQTGGQPGDLACQRGRGQGGEQNEGAVRNIESQWHKIYIGWHAILGQLKVQLQNEPQKGFFGALAKK